VGDEVAHVLRRLTYGSTPTLRADVNRMGLEPWIDQQLNPSQLPDPAVAAFIGSFGSLGATDRQNDDRDNEELKAELRHATVLRQMASTRQLYEVMVEFWANHFTVYLSESNMAYLKTSDDRTVARAHALGRFADMLVASANSPAMLEYLDNAYSNASSREGVNENWARELLELHTLGIIDGQQAYTESDVQGVARVMSGWSFDRTTDAFLFRANYHFTGPVSILGGAWQTAGKTGAAAMQDGVDLLNFLAHHPSTARHLAYKLVRHFVADEPDMGLVGRLAQAYLDNDTAIAPVLRALFSSVEFRAARGTKLRRPSELLIAVLRALNATVENASDSNAARNLTSILADLADVPFEWPSPDGYPDEASYWASTDGVLQRWELGGRLANNTVDGVRSDLARFVPNPLPATAGALIDGIGLQLIDGAFTAAEKDALLAHINKAADAAIQVGDFQGELGTLLGLAFASPSFQTR
jgi:uncharacterized protein (DUF1800 family)